MYDLMTYDTDFEIDDFYALDDFDGFSEYDDEDADELALGAILGGTVGAGLGSGAAGYLYDGASSLLNKYGGSRSRSVGRWLDSSPNFKNAVVGSGGFLGGLAGGVLGGASPTPEADPMEPEYDAENIDDMEALMEIALETDGEDAEEALDAMVFRAFGPMRAAANLRKVIGAIRAKVRQIVMRAKRDPRYRAVARVAPLALRRTAVTLLRMVARRQKVDARIAMRVFSGVMSKIMSSSRTRKSAVNRNRARAARRLRQRPQRSRSSRSRSYGRSHRAY